MRFMVGLGSLGHDRTMTTMGRFLTGLLVTLFAFAFGTSAAVACSCVEATTEEHAAHADLVARVLVERVDMPSNPGQVTYAMRPTHVWKGGVAAQFNVTSHSDGPSCGLEGITEGQDLVLFADGPDGDWSANLCGGTTTASEALVAELTDAVGPGGSVDVPPGVVPEAGSWVLPTVIGVGAIALAGGAALIWRTRKRV